MALFGKDKKDTPISNELNGGGISKKPTQTEKTINDFVMDLASKSPVPGGGGASAVAGAIGAALGSMVASLTIGKDKYKDVEVELTTLKTRAYNIQKNLLKLAEDDAQVFSKLSGVYKMPNGTDEEKESKSRLMESALKDAADVPLKIMKEACEAITLMKDFAEKGNPMAVSDAGCGVILCKSALQSAWLNVCINTKSMKDRDYANSINEEGIEMLRTHTMLADQIYASVEKELM